jgi:pimeloyl-ACP methyl ester carboxylesterase
MRFPLILPLGYQTDRTMKQRIILYLLATVFIASCSNHRNRNNNNSDKTIHDSMSFKSGYSDVNGIKIYYEIYGEGQPLVLLHGGGSTIETSFGRIIPQLAKAYQVIAVELQNHGRSGFRTIPQTFEQDADDVASLLKDLGIDKADFFGFSNGGHTCIEIYLRHPEIVNKLILASSPYKRSGFVPGFFEGFRDVKLESMPLQLREGFLKVNPDSAKLQMLFDHDVARMVAFKGWTDDQLRSIKAPTLIMSGDADVMTPECAVEMRHLIPNSELAVLPGEHGKYIGEITTLKNDQSDTVYIIPMVEEFLNRQGKQQQKAR